MTRYWLNTFDAGSWQYFLGLSASTLGAKSRRPQIAVDDVFLCYVRQEGSTPGQWVGAERVTSGMRHDDRIIYDDGLWPWRWDVEPAVPRRLFGCGIAGRDLIDDMTMYRGMAANKWGSAMRTQGREIPAADGELLVRLLAAPS